MAGHPSPKGEIALTAERGISAFLQCINMQRNGSGRFLTRLPRRRVCSGAPHASTMRPIYVLNNGDTPQRYYTGVTSDLRSRLEGHNAGRCRHTAKHRPWALDVAVKFADEARALKFEQYLKSGSGVEFARRHVR